MYDRLAALMEFAIENGRVCPQPKQWSKLWEMLPNRKQIGVGWEPPLPLILAAWHHTSGAEKRERFALHIRYAADHGVLEKIEGFLRGLPDNQWVYEGEV